MAQPRQLIKSRLAPLNRLINGGLENIFSCIYKEHQVIRTRMRRKGAPFHGA